MKQLIALIFTALLVGNACGKTCEEERLEQDLTKEVTYITAKEQCLVIGMYGNKKPKSMVILIHGDTVEPRVNARYSFQLARGLARRTEFKDTLFVAVVRPGSSDGDGRKSTAGWLDTTPPHGEYLYSKNNVTEVANAALKLKEHYSPSKVILSGLSGGAAIAALILDIFPDLAHGAVLSACPCDLVSWMGHRSMRSNTSLDPMKHVGNIRPDTKVIALTREGDTNTLPQHAKVYIDLLVKKGVNAEFRPIKKLEDHTGTFFDRDVWVAVWELINYDI